MKSSTHKSMKSKSININSNTYKNVYNSSIVVLRVWNQVLIRVWNQKSQTFRATALHQWKVWIILADDS